jgi:hypothetical protein
MKSSIRRFYPVVACLTFLIAVFLLTGYVFRKIDRSYYPDVKTELPLVPTDSTAHVVGSIFTGLFIFFGSPIGIFLVVLMLFLFLAFVYKK